MPCFKYCKFWRRRRTSSEPKESSLRRMIIPPPPTPRPWAWQQHRDSAYQEWADEDFDGRPAYWIITHHADGSFTREREVIRETPKRTQANVPEPEVAESSSSELLDGLAQVNESVVVPKSQQQQGQCRHSPPPVRLHVEQIEIPWFRLPSLFKSTRERCSNSIKYARQIELKVPERHRAVMGNTPGIFPYRVAKADWIFDPAIPTYLEKAPSSQRSLELLKWPAGYYRSFNQEMNFATSRIEYATSIDHGVQTSVSVEEARAALVDTIGVREVENAERREKAYIATVLASIRKAVKEMPQFTRPFGRPFGQPFGNKIVKQERKKSKPPPKVQCSDLTTTGRTAEQTTNPQVNDVKPIAQPTAQTQPSSAAPRAQVPNPTLDKAPAGVAFRRLRLDYLKLKQDPLPCIEFEVQENNLLTWYFVIHGLSGTKYDGGFYLGIVRFTKYFPFRPPQIVFLTPNGRFNTNESICMSNSDYHPEAWNPSWSVGSILAGILSFMIEETPTVGSIETTIALKRSLAIDSVYSCFQEPIIKKYFPELHLQLNMLLADRRRSARGVMIDMDKYKHCFTDETFPSARPIAGPSKKCVIAQSPAETTDAKTKNNESGSSQDQDQNVAGPSSKVYPPGTERNDDVDNTGLASDQDQSSVVVESEISASVSKTKDATHDQEDNDGTVGPPDLQIIGIPADPPANESSLDESGAETSLENDVIEDHEPSQVAENDDNDEGSAAVASGQQ